MNILRHVQNWNIAFSSILMGKILKKNDLKYQKIL